MKLDVICLGEALIDFVSLERDTSLQETSGFQKAAGGAPANVAAGVTKLGRRSGFIGKVGKDPFGDFLKAVLDEIGVDTACLIFDPDVRTTLSFIAQRSSGLRDCIFYRHPGADMLLNKSEIPETYIASADVLHFGSVSLSAEPSKSATRQAIKYARDHGLLVSYDPNLRLDLWRDGDLARTEIDEAFQYANIVKISEEESHFITGKDTPEETARYVLSRGPQVVVVTLGANGCYYSDGMASGYLPGFDVNAVDTTGAGDAFTAYLLSHIAQFRQVDGLREIKIDGAFIELLRRANAAGALATTTLGAIPSLPTTDQIATFLLEQ